MQSNSILPLLILLAGSPATGLAQAPEPDLLVGTWRTVPAAREGTAVTLILGREGSLARITGSFNRAPYEYDGRKLMSLANRRRQVSDVKIEGDTLRMRLHGQEQVFVRDRDVPGTGIIGQWNAFFPHPDPARRGLTPAALSFASDGTMRLDVTLTTQLGRYDVTGDQLTIDLAGNAQTFRFTVAGDTLEVYDKGRTATKWARIPAIARD